MTTRDPNDTNITRARAFALELGAIRDALFLGGEEPILEAIGELRRELNEQIDRAHRLEKERDKAWSRTKILEAEKLIAIPKWKSLRRLESGALCDGNCDADEPCGTCRADAVWRERVAEFEAARAPRPMQDLPVDEGAFLCFYKSTWIVCEMVRRGAWASTEGTVLNERHMHCWLPCPPDPTSK